jgi:hypothetical protein
MLIAVLHVQPTPTAAANLRNAESTINDVSLIAHC